MKKYRIVKYNRPSSTIYTIQKRVLFWWFNTDIDGDIVFPFLDPQYFVYEYNNLEQVGNTLERILYNKNKEIIHEV